MGGAALLAGLGTGLADSVTEHFLHKRARGERLSDEERRGYVDNLTGHIAGMQTNLAKIANEKGTESPEYAAQMDDITKAHGMLTDAFHPQNNENPMGAMAHLGRMVSEKLLHRPPAPEPTQTEYTRGPQTAMVQTAPAVPATPGTTQQGQGMNVTSPDLPALPATQTVVPPKAGPIVARQVPIPTAEEAKQQANATMAQFGAAAQPQDPMKTAGQKADFERQQQGLNSDAVLTWAAKQNLPPEAITELKQHLLGLPVTKAAIPLTGAKPYKGADGRYYVAVRDQISGLISAQAMPADYVPPPAVTHPSTAAQAQWTRATYGKDLEELTSEQAAEAVTKYRQMTTPDTSTTGQSLVFDNDNQAHVFTHTGTTNKRFGTGAPPAASGRSAAAPAATAPSATHTATQGAPSAAPAGSTTPTPASLKQKAQAITPKPPKSPIGPGLDMYKRTPEETVAKKAVDTAETAYRDVQKASVDPTPVGDQGVILAWLRGRVNRVTATEIQAVNNLGGAEMKLDGALVRIVSGKMTDQQRQWFLRSAKDNYEGALQVASKYNKSGAAAPVAAPAPANAGGFNWDAHPKAN